MQRYSESEDGLLSLLKLYLERFGDKACCFEDLRPYIALEGDELRSVVAHLEGLDHGTVSFRQGQAVFLDDTLRILEFRFFSAPHDQPLQVAQVPPDACGAYCRTGNQTRHCVRTRVCGGAAVGKGTSRDGAAACG